MALAGGASGATLTVTTTADGVNGSLRKKIAVANEGDTIRVPPGRYRLRLGRLEVTEAITIRGAGAERTVVDAERRSGVFQTASPTTAIAIKNLAITGGKEQFGAGIRNSGPLVVDRVVVSGNLAAGGGEVSNFGAGISSNGDLLVKRSKVIRNKVAESFYQAFGGGISFIPAAGADLRIIRSTLAGNEVLGSNGGGALFFSSIPDADPTNLMIRGSTIANNRAAFYGGGISFSSIADGGVAMVARISDSTISGNRAATDFAGGMYFGPIANDPGTVVALEMANVTISDNTAGTPTDSGLGGGLFLTPIAGSGGQAPMTFNNVTIAGNKAFVVEGSGGGGGVFSGAAGSDLLNPVFSNSIIAGNQASGSPDCQGPVVSNGNNLERHMSCGFSGPVDLFGTLPKLEPLRDNGGPTKTRALKPGSPAINNGNDASCEQRDQRGVVRPQGAHCDVGAYERRR